MKIICDKPKEFHPVTLILETQDEVNRMFALLNQKQISDAVSFETEWNLLSGFEDEGYKQYHDKLCEITK